MTNVRTFRFHAAHGPRRLFDTARKQLNELAGLNLELTHTQSRFAEREIPLHYLAGFDPQSWELIGVETAIRSGRITYMSLRRKVESESFLWIVIANEHVLTAWITEKPKMRATNPLIVKDGPVRDAVARGGELGKTPAFFDWEQTYVRRVRAHQLLAALASFPEHPNRVRLMEAANVALAGGTWTDAAMGAAYASPRSLTAAVTRVLRAAERRSRAEQSRC